MYNIDPNDLSQNFVISQKLSSPFVALDVVTPGTAYCMVTGNCQVSIVICLPRHVAKMGQSKYGIYPVESSYRCWALAVGVAVWCASRARVVQWLAPMMAACC